MRYLTSILGLFLIMSSCSSSRVTPNKGLSDPSATGNKEMELSKNETSAEFALETYLRKTPGVNVMGSGENARVQVRGVNSFNQNSQPLFIVNGSQIGQNYSVAANMLRGMTIKSVRVLKDSDATLYGARGAGGVIIIKAE